ncbi:MAG: phage/plasmid replication protein, II/X family [Immundisolibacter sp.]|uniref:phage/plasmid replication protein, II/X family n=1 Tax=Immundisolibacter sp. TaxID=1934948 RepID=UPI003EDF50BC
MIDWFSGYVGYDASQMVLGRFFEVSAAGEVIRDRHRWETARGSWESGVQVTRGEPTPAMLEASREQGFLCSETAVLRVSGNPVKFLQGHNVTGPKVSELGPVVQAMVRRFDEGFRPVDAGDPRLPAVHRSRVDVTTAVDMGSHQAVHDWLRAAAATTRSRHKGARVVQGGSTASPGTVYWGKNSTRWALKAYCKHCELTVHPPLCPELLADLLEWTRPHLRLELTLRRPELKDRGTLDESILWEFFRRVEMPTMKATGNFENLDLPPAAVLSLQSWLDGHDVSAILPRRTYYRYRRAILGQVGVDISMSAAEQMKADPDALLGVDELQRREVIEIPDRIQRSLFGAG